ncbi:flagellar FlbD family protein [Gottschalkia acidurici 9a]|uniref:Flagellar FlbD family protein n=1 Tax=Gottschalkia acidurici (strain ATCC 7906 / DSM 604 / BCRC 14475 / CIP 104303 / KCTC 5404 / NCIMB 10678 / 9a) TaxID=1128398 RepID=K0B0K7_GOTA9|nr:flagellar FlbD family protein [Gottschalkia acidurici]AFS78602.1 flagellar FlbD family protein [Gottschalkia acidurici 9a]
MIKLNRLNGEEFVVNNDLIETIEETPDTVITLITGKKIVVQESIEEVIEKAAIFKNKVFVYSKKEV